MQLRAGLWDWIVGSALELYKFCSARAAAAASFPCCSREPAEEAEPGLGCRLLPALHGAGRDESKLEEQYDCLKQKQKLQTHIIVFKTGVNETFSRESMISTVLINKKMRKAKAFEECVPVKEVSLELPCSGNTQEISPWRIHLGIHRLAQGDCQKGDVIQNKNEEVSMDSRILSQKESTMSSEELLERSEQSIALLSKQENASYPENTDRSASPSASIASPVWIHSQISTSKLVSASSKLPYYPFPQKKAPKISEAARRLGLYVSH